MKNLIFVIAVVIVYRFVFSLSGLIRTIHYQKIYESYLKGACNDFAVHTAPVKKLFQQAKVSDIVLPYTDFVGGGHFRVTNVSVFENMAKTREDTVSAIQNCFSKARGTFRMNILECLSPLYWVQLVAFLPSKLCEYFGVSEKKFAPKIFQLLYWVLTPLLLCFRTQLYDFIVQLLQKA